VIVIPLYKYKAKDITGKILRGTAHAESQLDLISQFALKQIFVIKCRETADKSKQIRLSSRELAEFARELSTMLSAGISMVKAFDIIIKRDNQPHLKKVYNELYQCLVNGMSFSEAAKAQGPAFPELFINMIYAGEAGGQIDSAITKTAVYYEKESRLNARIKSASTYPKVLLCITALVVILLFTVILPGFFSMFEDISLPFATRIVLAASRFSVKYWYLLLMVGSIIVYLFIVLKKQDRVRLFIDKNKLQLPKIKNLLMIIYTSRLARTISALYDSGLSLVNCIKAAQGTIGNKYIESQIPEVANQITNGVPLSKAIMSVDGLDPKLPSIIVIGEETGKLSDMLTAVADSFDYESEMATQRIITALEPIMIVLMALIVGGIMVSVLLPITQLYHSIG
jgi:type IV pilus assembly protein PilC